MEIKVMHQVMAWNEDVSDAVKATLADHQVCLVNVMGSPGAGKTSTIVALINALRENYRIGVIEGDNGFAVLFEPRWTYQLSANTALQLFAFIDWGTVWTSKSVWGVPDSQDAASAGAGIRLSGHEGEDYLPGFNISAFIAQPLKEAGDDPGDSPRFVLQVGLSF